MRSVGAVTALADRVLESPRLYDRVQRIFGLYEVREKVADVLLSLEPGTVLDVGAGTGNFYPVIPAEFEYIALDVDDKKLGRIREKYHGIRTVKASGTEIPFADAAVDHTLCIAVSHHLTDVEFDRLVFELARVTRQKLVFVDALNVPRLRSRALWSIDRGSHPRSVDVLRRTLERRFAIEQIEIFTIHHRYAIVVASTPMVKTDRGKEPPA
jgi:SAM-dependent methyltransferase